MNGNNKLSALQNLVKGIHGVLMNETPQAPIGEPSNQPQPSAQMNFVPPQQQQPPTPPPNPMMNTNIGTASQQPAYTQDQHAKWMQSPFGQRLQQLMNNR